MFNNKFEINQFRKINQKNKSQSTLTFETGESNHEFDTDPIKDKI
jgi:hypothetical protein